MSHTGNTPAPFSPEITSTWTRDLSQSELSIVSCDSVSTNQSSARSSVFTCCETLVWLGQGGGEEGLVWGDASAVWVEHISTSVSCNKTLGVSGVNHEDDTRDNIEC